MVQVATLVAGILAAAVIASPVTGDDLVGPPGTSSNIGQHGIIRPTVTCPKGYSVNGKTCLKIEYADISYTCPRGTSLEQPATTTLLETSPQCISFRQTLPNYVCPDGYTTTRDKRCERVTQFPARLECDPGANLVDQECKKIVHYDVSFACPRGSKLEGSRCVALSKEPLVPRCPDDRKLEFDRDRPVCKRIDTESPLIRCPPGYIESPVVRKGPAASTGDLSSSSLLSATHIYEATECVRYDKQPLVLECAKGYKAEPGTGCTRTLEAGRPEAHCKTGVIDGTSKKVCRIVEEHMPSVICRKGFNLDEPNRCIKIYEMPPDVICDKGYKLSESSLDDSTCERKLESNAILTCPTGTELVGRRCVAQEQVPPTVSCPKGFEESADGTCIKRIGKRPDIVCPTGFHLSGNACLLIQKSPPQMVCPDGAIKHGSSCQTTEVIEAKPSCRKGRMQPDGSCSDRTIKNPKVFCPRGYQHIVEDGVDSCVSVDTIRPDKVCPAGTTTRGDQCDKPKIVEAVRSCPKGFVVGISGRCQRAHASDAKPICPNGLKLIGGLCRP